MTTGGETYGKYELVERIATGGMAEVFRAVSTSIGGFRKPVALKRILPHLSTDAEFVSLFIEEAKLSVSLAHGNIVQVFDFGRIDNNYFLAMELVDGRDLTQILVEQSRRGRPMPPEAALFIMIGVLRGLAHAHGRKDSSGGALGIVHRDVSPHNVLVSFEGEVKLADFGIATAASKVSLTRPGMRLGKFAYMSPEQARGQPVDFRTDIWAAGVTLFECFTGRRLFYHEDPSVILARVRDPQVPAPSSLSAHLSPALDELVLTALSTNPEDRPRSARAYAADLQSELHNIAPRFDDADLIRYLSDLLGNLVGLDRFPEVDGAALPAPPIRRDTRVDSHVATRFDLASEMERKEAPPLERLFESFRHDPDLWTVVELAERLVEQQRLEEGVLALRVAALKFAQAGLRAQALRQWVRASEIVGWRPELSTDIESLPRTEGVPNVTLAKRVGAPRITPVAAFLNEVLAQGEPPEGPRGVDGFLDGLDGAELRNLASALDRGMFSEGETVVREGELGTRLYVIARGRVLIHCTGFHGAKVYLSALSDGDGFGEMSFFTGDPRAATVEALDEVEVLSFERQQLSALQASFPRLVRSIAGFHRRRIASLLLAKSDVFGSLRTQDRRWLVPRLVPIAFGPGQSILREGDSGRDIFLIASGEVEVFRGANEVFLDKLQRGDVFGEGAALSGRPRSAGVRALGPVELLRLDGADLAELCARAPEVRSILEAESRRREAETIRRLTEGGLLV